MRVLITGAGGFVGRAVARAALARGDEPVALVRTEPPSPPSAETHRLPPPWTTDALADVLARFAPDAVVHAAGGPRADSAATYRDNAVLAADLLDAVARTAPGARVVVVGSAAEYGPPRAADGVCRETDPPRPERAYGIAKLAQTHHALAHARRGGSAAVARVFNPVGPGMPPGPVASDIARRLAAGPERLEVGDTGIARDFFPVDEAARVLLDLVHHGGASGRIVNVASGVGTTLRVLVERLLGRARVRSGRATSLQSDPAAHGPAIPIVVGGTETLDALGIRPPAPDIGAALDALFDSLFDGSADR